MNPLAGSSAMERHIARQSIDIPEPPQIFVLQRSRPRAPLLWPFAAGLGVGAVVLQLIGSW